MVNGHIDLEVIIFKILQYALVLFVGYLSWRGFLDWLAEIKDEQILRLNQKIENTEARKKLWLAKQEFKELKKSRKPLTFLEKLSLKIFPEEEDYVELNIDRSSPETIVNEPISKEDLDQLNKDRLTLINEVHPEDETYCSNIYATRTIIDGISSLPKQVIEQVIEPLKEPLEKAVEPFAEFAKELTPEETEGVDIPTLSDCLKKDPDFLAHSEDSSNILVQNISSENVPCQETSQKQRPKQEEVKKKGIFNFFGFRRKKHGKN